MQSLNHLIDLGLLERNPGHGHPLRPEYRLTQGGITVASAADQIRNLVPRTHGCILIRRAWTIPVLVVSKQPRYFKDIKLDLGSITDRALSQSIKHLEAQNWLEREVNVEFRPPRPMYRAINTGAQICRAANLSGA